MGLLLVKVTTLLVLIREAFSWRAWVNETGAVYVMVDGETWLVSSEVMVGAKKASRGDLRLKERRSWVEGTYEATSMVWSDSKNISVNATVKIGNDSVVFSQTFPDSIENLENATATTATVFPAFERVDKECFAYHGKFPSLKSCDFMWYEESHQGGQPLILYSKTSAVVFSALDNFKAQHMASNQNWVGAGVKARIDEIPANWTQAWILTVYESTSTKHPPIRAAMDAWGASILRWNDGDFGDNRYLDKVHGYIGYWTDNGGYYHYSTGNNESNNATYESVFRALKQEHDSLKVPFRHWQFDSWFYPKDGAVVNSGGGGGAVVNWTATDDVFPDGIPFVMSEILVNISLVAHNRQWSVVSDYILNKVEDVEWLVTGEAPTGSAIPRDPATFFEYFFQQQQGWHLEMYEQDWMCDQYDKVEALQTNLTLADDWLRGMADGVQKSNRTQQYCMPYPHDILASAALPAVTNARATDDYFHAPNHSNWAIGATALFYSALNLLPFKDGFYSSSNPQIGGQTVGPEPCPDREILMAVLSTAMVGPMDGLGLLNATRVLSACRSDGLILKPDRAIKTVDACFSFPFPEFCYVYQTFSSVPSFGTVHYLYIDDLSHPVASLPIGDLISDFYHHQEIAVLDWYSPSNGVVYGNSSTLTLDQAFITPGYEGHAYALVSPIIDGWAFFGELDKYAPASSTRFTKVESTSFGLAVDLDLADGESITVCAVTQPSTRLVCQPASSSLLFSSSDEQISS